ncbi:MAG: PrsW family intramembrane metalloprotease [Chloroflexi bacterium]|nr:PrsW family intramembrane metalloprotease [Chloroflexota bacterium]
MEEGVSYRRSIWISSLITLVGFALYIGISAFIPRPNTPAGLLLLGIFLTLIPAIIWLAFFYQQDRSEPEPMKLVIRMFVFGGIAGAVAVAFNSQIADPLLVRFNNLLISFIVTFFTVSLIQEVLKVAMVRYVVLGTNVFDQHPDGIVYGLACGLGFGTILTLAFVVNTEGVVPLAAALQAVDNVLIHGALGAVGGYYIGRVKIDGKNIQWMITGLLLVTLINAVYQVASSQLAGQLDFNPWISLAVSVGLAIVVIAVLFYFFRRALMRAAGDLTTVSMAINARSKVIPWDIAQRYDFLLIGGIVIALAVSLGTGVALNGQSRTYTADEIGLTFSYPATWSEAGETIGSVTLRDFGGRGIYKPTFIVDSEKIGGDSLELAAAGELTRLAGQNAFYVELGRNDNATVAGNDAIQVEYQFATETAAGPAVVTGIITFVEVDGELFMLRYQADASVFDGGLPLYNRLLNSVRFE